jgi:hypothetical protein
VAIQEDMSAKWELYSLDIDKFRNRINTLLTWGYALFIVGILAAAAGHFEFIIVLATSLLVCGVIIRQLSARLGNIADALQGHYSSAILTVNLSDEWGHPYHLLNSAETVRFVTTSELENSDFENKPFSYPIGWAQLEAEIDYLKDHAIRIFMVTALVYLTIVPISLPIIESGNTENIGRWCFLWLFAFIPTYLMPAPLFLIICFELVFTGKLAMPLITAAELTPKSIMIIIAIAATAAYRIFGICMGYRANNLRLRLMSSSIPSHCTSEAEE